MSNPIISFAEEAVKQTAPKIAEIIKDSVLIAGTGIVVGWLAKKAFDSGKLDDTLKEFGLLRNDKED